MKQLWWTPDLACDSQFHAWAEIVRRFKRMNKWPDLLPLTYDAISYNFLVCLSRESSSPTFKLMGSPALLGVCSRATQKVTINIGLLAGPLDVLAMTLFHEYVHAMPEHPGELDAFTLAAILFQEMADDPTSPPSLELRNLRVQASNVFARVNEDKNSNLEYPWLCFLTTPPTYVYVEERGNQLAVYLRRRDRSAGPVLTIPTGQAPAQPLSKRITWDWRAVRQDALSELSKMGFAVPFGDGQ